MFKTTDKFTLLLLRFIKEWCSVQTSYMKAFEVENVHKTLKLLKEKTLSDCSLRAFTNYKSSHPDVLE